MDCPLGIQHPRAGHLVKNSAFPLGCALCDTNKATEVVFVTDEMRRKHEENLEFRVIEEKRLEEVEK